MALSTNCPACSGAGNPTDAASVLRCASCGGVFTVAPIIMEVVIAFVKVHVGMLANAGPAGMFYFDFMVTRPSDGGVSRMHGWADVATKQVVQWG